jgi:hypothetical protein
MATFVHAATIQQYFKTSNYLSIKTKDEYFLLEFPSIAINKQYFMSDECTNYLYLFTSKDNKQYV